MFDIIQSTTSAVHNITRLLLKNVVLRKIHYCTPMVPHIGITIELSSFFTVYHIFCNYYIIY